MPGSSFLRCLFTAILVPLAGCNSSGGPNGFVVASFDLADGGTFASSLVFTGCAGGNISPEINWGGVPSDAKSLAVTMYDPDAPTLSGFWHWTVYNIPPNVNELARGAGNPASGLAPAGSTLGKNDFGTIGYGGPCPPAGDKPHRYIITVYALNVAKIDVPATAPPAQVGFNLHAATIGKVTLTATFQSPGSPVTFPEPPTLAGFTLRSAEMSEGGTIALEQVFNSFGCTGGNISPSLSWSGVPADAKSLALVMFDPDAPTGSGFYHWTLFNMPPTTTSLPKNAGVPTAGLAPAGSIQGLTDYGINGYGGPCPPAGNPPHRYEFHLYAMKVATLGPDATTPTAQVSFQSRNQAIAQAVLTAKYGR
jgi:Raf kinase inhibitor-like YbhB/YbcL family protein